MIAGSMANATMPDRIAADNDAVAVAADIAAAAALPLLPANTNAKHSLRMGWRNFFSSCAVVSVFGSGGK